ncbi:hypothetical protein [Streptomyces griseofuscus]|uniref:hypothetical protein n=1 Tax=Streptomyces griseofuscus TaxID=146922 RepID=UPI003816FA38
MSRWSPRSRRAGRPPLDVLLEVAWLPARIGVAHVGGFVLAGGPSGTREESAGATLALIGEEPSGRDLTTSARLRDTVLASVTTDSPTSFGSDLASRALTLDAALESVLAAGSPATGTGVPLRDTETALLREWLQRPAG